MRQFFSLCLATAVFAMTSCGGSGGSGNGAPPATAAQIIGVAATGAALTFARVEISSTDGSSPCVETDIWTDGLGAYLCTMKADKTAPFFIVVTDPAGNTPPLVSIATTTPDAGKPLTVNATPLTTAIVAQLNGGDALGVVSDKTKFSVAKFNAIKANVLEQLKATLASIGAPPDYDPFTTSITAATAGQAGNTADQVLDVIKITYTSDMQLAFSTIADPTPIRMATDTERGASLPAPPDSIGDLSRAGTAIAKAFEKCYALDVSERVTMSGSEIANVATECTGLVADATSPPGVPRYLNNGFAYTARCWEFNCPSMYNWLTSGTMTNAKFSVPEIMAYYPSGTGQPQDIAVWNIRFKDKDGVPGNKILEVQRFVGSSGNVKSNNWLITGNQGKYNISVQAAIRRNIDRSWTGQPESFPWPSQNNFWSGVHHYISARSWAPLINTFDSVHITGRGLPTDGLWYVRSTSGDDYSFIVATNRKPPPQNLSALGQSCASCIWFWMARTAGLEGDSASILGPNNPSNEWVQKTDRGAYDGKIESKRPLKGDVHTFNFYKDGGLVDTEVRRLMTDLVSPLNLSKLPWHGDVKNTLDAIDIANVQLNGLQTSLKVDWVINPKAEFIDVVWISQIDGNFHNRTPVALGAFSVDAKPKNLTAESISRFTSLTGPVNYDYGPVDGYRNIGLQYRTTDGSYKVTEYWVDPAPPDPKSNTATGFWTRTDSSGGVTRLVILDVGVVLGERYVSDQLTELTDFIVGNSTGVLSEFKLLNYDFSKTKSTVSLGTLTGTVTPQSKITATDENGQLVKFDYDPGYLQNMTQSDIAGTYLVEGTTLQRDINKTSITINANGTFTFDLGGCTITGIMYPRGPGIGVYNTGASASGIGCDLGTGTLKGITRLDKAKNKISIMTVTANRMRGLILQGKK